jgi:flagellar hook-associated protein 1 FlgK
MSGLLGNLQSAARALAAHEAGVQVAGRNLANVNNPAYARQRVQLGDRVIIDSNLGPVGNGVEALGIQHIRDRFLDIAVTREGAQSAYLRAQQSGLERAEANLGEQINRSEDSSFVGDLTSSSDGLSAAINDFFTSFDGLAASPRDAGLKPVLLEKADILANKFNVADARLVDLQSDLTSEVTTGVGETNRLLGEIANLNAEIAKFEVDKPLSALDLRDQRQARLEDLAKFIDFTATPIANGSGQIQITAKDGTGADVVLVDRAAVHGLTFDGTQISAGAPSTLLGLKAGSLQGQLDVRDGAIQDLRDNLKRTADQITTAVNAAYSPTGSNFFNAAPASGLMALDASLNINTLKATATTDAGANEIALAVADLARQTFSTGGGALIDGTISEFYNKTVSGLGVALSSVNSKLGDQELVQELMTKQRDAVSGVSMDEEMADLIKFQRAYQASSRVLTVIDSMLDTLINRTAP